MHVMSMADVASEARISAATLGRRYRAGNGPRTYKTGRSKFILRSDFENWLRSQPVAA